MLVLSRTASKLVLSFSSVCCFPSNAGAEVEPQPADAHLLAQCLHAGGLPEGDGGAAHSQIPSGYLYADR